MEKLLNVRETAGLLRVSPNTVRAWVFQQRMHPTRLGRRVLFKESDISKIIEKGLPEGKLQAQEK